MNKFEEFFKDNLNTLTITKWHHYLNIYDRHFARYKNTTPNILEIGTGGGGSAEMLNYYFNGKCTIVTFDGTDWGQAVEKYPNIKYLHGLQDDIAFLKTLKTIYGKFDIIIDDASHEMVKTITSFKELYEQLSDTGTYLIEDTHTSYWSEYLGGVETAGTLVEFTKKLIDKLNIWHWRQPFMNDDLTFCKTTDSIHYYDSVIVIEKRPAAEKPICERKEPAGNGGRVWDDNRDWLHNLLK